MSAVARYEPVVDVLRAPTRDALLRQVGRAMARGELGATDVMRQTPTGWAVQVYRVKPAGRNPTPVYVAGGAVVVLAAAAALGWWLVDPVSAWLAGAAPVAAGLLALRGLVAVATRDGGCTITHTRH